MLSHFVLLDYVLKQMCLAVPFHVPWNRALGWLTLTLALTNPSHDLTPQDGNEEADYNVLSTDLFRKKKVQVLDLGSEAGLWHNF